VTQEDPQWLREESGFTTRAVKVLAVFDREKQGQTPPFAFHVYKLFILCEIESGQPAASVETVEVAFFAEDSIPPLSQTRVTPSQIARCFAHLKNPGWPTDFD